MGAVGLGSGALLGVSKIRLLVGGVGTSYPAPPRLFTPGSHSRARSVLDTGVGRWGGGRGRSRHRRAPFYPPSPGAAPKKKAPGKGG